MFMAPFIIFDKNRWSMLFAIDFHFKVICTNANQISV